MKVVIFSLLALFLPHSLSAQEAWETCLDKADFSFNVNSFMKAGRFTKLGCQVSVVEIGGKGSRYEFNLCDPAIHIKYFPSLDATSSKKLYAGSSNCPAPLFGADFDLPPGQKGSAEFGETTEQIFQIINAARTAIAPKVSAKDAEKYKSAKELDSEGQMACGLLLASEYLERCVAFEAQEKSK